MNFLSKFIYKIRMRKAVKSRPGFIHLLAYDGKAPNQRFGWLGMIVHNTTKEMCRVALGKIHGKMQPAIHYKEQNGFINNHIKVMSEEWKWVMNTYENPLNRGIGGLGWNPGNDRNRKMFQQVHDIALTWLDEDTAYAIPILVWLYRMHLRWPEIEQSARQAYLLANFPELMKDLIEWNEPLPEDDGTDVADIDYIALEKKVRERKDADTR